MVFCRRSTVVGYLLLAGIRSPERSIELRRIALSARDKRLGSAALDLALGFSFDVIAASRVWLDVLADNSRALRIYERAGFHDDGPAPAPHLLPDGSSAQLRLMSIREQRWRELPAHSITAKPETGGGGLDGEHALHGRSACDGRTRRRARPHQRRRARGRPAAAQGDGRPGRRHQPRAAVRGRLRRLLRGRPGRRRAPREGRDRRRRDRLESLAVAQRQGRLRARRRARRDRCPASRTRRPPRISSRPRIMVCPYSNATRGNIEVALTANGEPVD